MNPTELYMLLECLTHLRDLPEYAGLRADIQRRLKAANEASIPSPPKAPTVDVPRRASTTGDAV